MKTLSFFLVTLALVGVVTAADSVHDITIGALNGKALDLKSFKGRAVLFVNVASECGYTGQYRGLQMLHQQMKDKGLVVVGVPCNDFGGQEPAAPKEIAAFCKKNFGVTFPLTEKIRIAPGKGQHPLYSMLTAGGDPVGWNFEKILVGPDGKVAKRFTSDVEPDDQELLAAIKQVTK